MKVFKNEVFRLVMIWVWIFISVSTCAMGTEMDNSLVGNEPPGLVAKPGESKVTNLIRLNQWAIRAKASSQYGSQNWAAFQATGEPNTRQCGDQPTAWASKNPNSGIEWIELNYSYPVWVEEINIHETLNPGGVAKVEVKKADGTYSTVWEGYDPTRVCPGTLKIIVNHPVMTGTIRVILDTTRVSGWDEIDAIELVGEGSQ